MAASWKQELVYLVRGLIGDWLGSSYSESRLEEFIVICAQLTQNDISFDTTYTIDTDLGTISPDPVVNRDNAFINLVSLKTAYLIAKSEYREQSSNVAKFKDRETSIDNTDMLKGKQKLMEEMKEAYEEAKFQYTAGSDSPGKLVGGPMSHPDIVYPIYGDDRYRI